MAPTPRRRSNTRQARAENHRILAASTICHICGKPGADAVDHVIPLARGGADDASNKRPAHHDVAPYCNRRKSDHLPSEVDRKVVMVCGPPGAGKSTHAHTLGLDVYDLDDERWGWNEGLFKAELIRLRENPKARAVVIRTGATLSARQRAASMCGATDLPHPDPQAWPRRTITALPDQRGEEVVGDIRTRSSRAVVRDAAAEAVGKPRLRVEQACFSRA